MIQRIVAHEWLSELHSAVVLELVPFHRFGEVEQRVNARRTNFLRVTLDGQSLDTTPVVIDAYCAAVLPPLHPSPTSRGNPSASPQRDLTLLESQWTFLRTISFANPLHDGDVVMNHQTHELRQLGDEDELLQTSATVTVTPAARYLKLEMKGLLLKAKRDRHERDAHVPLSIERSIAVSTRTPTDRSLTANQLAHVPTASAIKSKRDVDRHVVSVAIEEEAPPNLSQTQASAISQERGIPQHNDSAIPCCSDSFNAYSRSPSNHPHSFLVHSTQTPVQSPTRQRQLMGADPHRRGPIMSPPDPRGVGVRSATPPLPSPVPNAPAYVRSSDVSLPVTQTLSVRNGCQSADRQTEPKAGAELSTKRGDEVNGDDGGTTAMDARLVVHVPSPPKGLGALPMSPPTDVPTPARDTAAHILKMKRMVATKRDELSALLTEAASREEELERLVARIRSQVSEEYRHHLIARECHLENQRRMLQALREAGH